MAERSRTPHTVGYVIVVLTHTYVRGLFVTSYGGCARDFVEYGPIVMRVLFLGTVAQRAGTRHVQFSTSVKAKQNKLPFFRQIRTRCCSPSHGNGRII